MLNGEWVRTVCVPMRSFFWKKSFCTYVLSILSFLKLKTEGQLIKREYLTVTQIDFRLFWVRANLLNWWPYLAKCLIIVNAAPVSEYRASHVEETRCRHAVCLCDLEMVRCMGHYKSVIDTDNILHQQCNVTGNMFVQGRHDLHHRTHLKFWIHFFYLSVDSWYTIKKEWLESLINRNL